MSFNSKRLDTSAAPATGVLTGLAAGTQTGAGSIALHRILPGTLAADVEVDAETSTIQLFADWQVSRDGTNWLTVSGTPGNAANVVLATGTGGADPSVRRIIPAPMAVYAFPFARVAIRNEVAAGLVADTYSVSYSALRA
jgi:hypothetical protein